MSSATKQQLVTDDLRRWIVAQAEAGCRPDDVLAAMRAAGWEEDTAIEAMEHTLSERLDQIRAAGGARAEAAASPAVALPPAVPVPQVGYDASARPLLAAGGREVRVLVTAREPSVVVFGGLLSDEECDQVMALAGPRLERSLTVEVKSGGSEVNEARTSDGMFFQRAETELIERIEQRIAHLLNWPLENGEGMQVLRYRPGAEYKPHHDYFDPVHSGTPKILERGGQRVGTVVMYLNTPEGGGATTFPDAGLVVAPIKGNAVFFSYDRAHPSTKTLHGGAPVTAGEKWVATKWLREREFV